jgi:AcrR family transcriptional regulator
MARRSARTQPVNTTLQKGRKSTQRERLVNGMIAVGNRDGYAHANVSAVIEQAGVSRPTFYDYFTDRDDCFLAVLADIQARLAAEVRQAVESQAPEQALEATIGVLVAFASSEPAMALFLMSEAMAAGPRALDARDEGIAEIEQIIEEAYRQAPAGTAIPDVSSRIVIGGLYRLLASRLRRGEPGIAGLLEDLLDWIRSYEQPAGEHRWRTLKPGPPPAPSPLLAQTPLRAPSALPPGRPGLSTEQVAENHRLRILFAAAQLAEEKGYNATTIADITRLAGVDGRAFYASFPDKQDAFMTVHEIGVQQVMSATAGAFFTGASWPERMWEAGRAFTGFLESNPMITHVGFVQAYAVGPGAVQRIEDSHIAFTIFLQEGYEHQPQRTPPPSRLALEAMITSIFEIVYHQARESAEPKISGLLGHMAFLCLTPFLGAAEANRFIDQPL